jgi:hypothetical protein
MGGGEMLRALAVAAPTWPHPQIGVETTPLDLARVGT